VPRRGRISDKRFEQQLLAYNNKHLPYNKYWTCKDQDKDKDFTYSYLLQVAAKPTIAIKQEQ